MTTIAEQPLYRSSGERYAEVFLRPRAELGLVEVFVLRWRDVPDADGLSEPIREALTLEVGWQVIAPGCEAPRYDAIVSGRAGVTIDIDLLAGVIDRARAQIDAIAVDAELAEAIDNAEAAVDRAATMLLGPFSAELAVGQQRVVVCASGHHWVDQGGDAVGAVCPMPGCRRELSPRDE